MKNEYSHDFFNAFRNFSKQEPVPGTCSLIEIFRLRFFVSQFVCFEFRIANEWKLFCFTRIIFNYQENLYLERCDHFRSCALLFVKTAHWLLSENEILVNSTQNRLHTAYTWPSKDLFIIRANKNRWETHRLLSDPFVGDTSL